MSKTRLKELRIQKGLSQKQLAVSLNLGKTTVSHYENGERNIPTEFIVMFAEFFGVSADYFLGIEDTPTPESGLDGNTKMLIEVLKQANLSELSFTETAELEELIKTNIAQIKRRHSTNGYSGIINVAQTRTK